MQSSSSSSQVTQLQRQRHSMQSKKQQQQQRQSKDRTSALGEQDALASLANIARTSSKKTQHPSDPLTKTTATFLELTNTITLMAAHIVRLRADLEQQRCKIERLRDANCAKHKRATAAAKRQQKQKQRQQQQQQQKQPRSSSSSSAAAEADSQVSQEVPIATTTTATIAEDDARLVQSASSSTNGAPATTLAVVVRNRWQICEIDRRSRDEHTWPKENAWSRAMREQSIYISFFSSCSL